MRHFTAVLHACDPDEGGFWATCLEIRGANGQSETKEECLEDLAEAVKLILEVLEEDTLKDDPHGEKVSFSIP